MADSGVRWANGRWELRVTIDGQAYTRTAHYPDTKVGKRKAESLRKAWVQDLKDGVVQRSVLFDTLADEFILHCDHAKSTRDGNANLIDRWWRPVFGGMKVDQIRPRMIRQRLTEFDVSQKTKKNALTPLRQVLDLAIEDDLIDSNPAAAVRIKRGQKARVERFTQAERHKIMAHLTGPAYQFYALAFYAGLRTSEILGLQWEDVEMDEIHVQRAIVRREIKETKTYKRRRVFINRQLALSLCATPWVDREGWIFTNSTGGPHLDADFFTGRWNLALQQAGVRYRKPYTCRHTRASDLLMAGVEPAFAARQMGHSLEMFLNTYADWIEDARSDQQKALVQEA